MAAVVDHRRAVHRVVNAYDAPDHDGVVPAGQQIRHLAVKDHGRSGDLGLTRIAEHPLGALKLLPSLLCKGKGGILLAIGNDVDQEAAASLQRSQRLRTGVEANNHEGRGHG